jgi:hypothetical protein
MPPSPPEDPHGLPAPANPFGIRLLRFFLWLLPAGFVVGWPVFFGWFYPSVRGASLAAGVVTPGEFIAGLVWLLGLGSWIATGWFDATFAMPCRLGQRSKQAHVVMFVLAQLLIAPAILIAVVFAVCAISPPVF